jgi:hypothetical protein
LNEIEAILDENCDDNDTYSSNIDENNYSYLDNLGSPLKSESIISGSATRKFRSATPVSAISGSSIPETRISGSAISVPIISKSSKCSPLKSRSAIKTEAPNNISKLNTNCKKNCNNYTNNCNSTCKSIHNNRSHKRNYSNKEGHDCNNNRKIGEDHNDKNINIHERNVRNSNKTNNSNNHNNDDNTNDYNDMKCGCEDSHSDNNDKSTDNHDIIDNNGNNSDNSNKENNDNNLDDKNSTYSNCNHENHKSVEKIKLNYVENKNENLLIPQNIRKSSRLISKMISNCNVSTPTPTPVKLPTSKSSTGLKAAFRTNTLNYLCTETNNRVFDISELTANDRLDIQIKIKHENEYKKLCDHDNHKSGDHRDMKLNDNTTNKNNKKHYNNSHGLKEYYDTSSPCTDSKIPSKKNKSVEKIDNKSTPNNRDDDNNLVSTDDTNCRRSVRSRTVLTNPDFEYDYDDYESDRKKNSNKKKKMDISNG